MCPFRTTRPNGTNVEAHDRFFTSARELSLQPSCETILHDTMLIIHDRTTGSNSRPRQLQDSIICYIIYFFSTPLKLLPGRIGKPDGPTVVIKIDRRQYTLHVSIEFRTLGGQKRKRMGQEIYRLEQPKSRTRHTRNHAELIGEN
jgi:hypothetical protein